VIIIVYFAIPDPTLDLSITPFIKKLVEASSLIRNAMDFGYILNIPEEEIVVSIGRNPHDINMIKAELTAKWIQTNKYQATSEAFARKLSAVGGR